LLNSSTKGGRYMPALAVIISIL